MFREYKTKIDCKNSVKSFYEKIKNDEANIHTLQKIKKSFVAILNSKRIKTTGEYIM